VKGTNEEKEQAEVTNREGKEQNVYGTIQGKKRFTKKLFEVTQKKKRRETSLWGGMERAENETEGVGLRLQTHGERLTEKGQ